MIQAEVAYRTLKGIGREQNEDHVGSVIPAAEIARARKGVICAIADGVGGHGAGHIASAAAVKALLDDYYAPSSSTNVKQALRRAMATANLRVNGLSDDHAEYRHMATTLTVVVLVGASAHVGHVGDSRVYHLRGDSWKQITQDHTEVAQLVELGIVKPEMAIGHPFRHVLTRSVGQQPAMEPDFFQISIQPGDIMVQCTDGVWSEMEDREMAKIVRFREPQVACEQILDLCLSRGCQNDMAVQIVRVDAIDDGSRGVQDWPGAHLLSRLHHRDMHGRNADGRNQVSVPSGGVSPRLPVERMICAI